MMRTIKPQDFGRVAVLMGGPSAERDISFMTGEAVCKALQNRSIDAVPVDVQADIAQHLLDNHYDRAFIALHGPFGEDGTIQGLLEILRVPYTGSGVMASALTMDKLRCKSFWRGMDLPVLPDVVITEDTDLQALVDTLGLPLAIKPNAAGSSQGITKVKSLAAIQPAYLTALEYDDTVFAEPWIEGPEFTVGILGDQALPVIDIRPGREFYDYDAKYFVDDTEYLPPNDLSQAQIEATQQLALKAFQTCGAQGWGRVDMIQSAQGAVYLLELNTIPGLTSHSLVPKAARRIGIDFEQLVWDILKQTL